jgi:signal transduction histidine kinase
MEEEILKRIYESVLKFLSPLTSDVTFSTIVHEAIKLVGGEDGAILLENNGELEKVYSSSPEIAAVKTRKRGFTYNAYISRKAFVVEQEQLWGVHPEQKKSIRSVLFIPLSYKNESFGALIVRSKVKGAKFKNKDLEILKLFGSMASLAIRKTQLYDETKEAIRIRDIFISMAAHELRTPLTTISGYSQLLKSKFGDKSSVESRWINQLFYQTFRLNLIVNELVEAIRLRSGKKSFVWRECKVRSVVGKTLKNFRTYYPHRSIKFEDLTKDGEDVIVGDQERLIQALNNILDNAVKFSPDETKINVSIDSKHDDVVISIQDKGKGIPEKDLENIFKGFYSGKDKVEGFGLGLYLVKEIIANHHGYVKVKSKIGKGTVFKVFLPMSRHD